MTVANYCAKLFILFFSAAISKFCNKGISQREMNQYKGTLSEWQILIFVDNFCGIPHIGSGPQTIFVIKNMLFILRLFKGIRIAQYD